MSAARREWIGAALLLGVLTLISLWPLPLRMGCLIMPSRGAFSDLAISHWPMQSLWRESVRQSGAWPFWMPTYFSGQPLAGNPLAGFHYPPNWLHAALPTEIAFAVLALLHVGFGALGMFALMRKGAGLSAPGAMLSAVVFAFGPRLAAHLGAGHVSIVYGWAWLPWAAWAALTARTWRDGWRLGLLLAAAFLADVRMGYYAALAAAAIGLARGIASRSRRPWVSWRRWGATVIAVALAFAGGAAFLALPLLELLGQATRAGLSPHEAMALSLPPAALIGAVLPLEPATHEWVTYLGLPAIAAAVAAFWGARRKAAWALWAAAVVSAALALGANTPLYGVAFRVLPGLGLLRVPARFWILALGCVAALAGMGVDALAVLECDAKTRQRATVALGAMLVVMGALGGFMALARLGSGAAYLRLSIAAVGMALLALAMRGKAARVAVVLLLCAVFADAAIASRVWWRLATVEEVIAPGREVAAYLANLPDRGRVYSPSYSVPQQAAWFYGLETADGVDPTQLRLYRQFMAAAGGYEDAEYTVTIPPFPPDEPPQSAWRGTTPNARLLGLLNVTHLAAAFPVQAGDWEPMGQTAGVYVYRNARAMPRAWLAHEVHVASDDEALRRLGDADLERQALIPPEHAAHAVGAGGDSVADAARIAARSANRLELDVQASAPGLLVISEVWYPGWRAWVDGEPAPVIRADFVLRAVPIAESGRHTVRLVYAPTWFYAGAAISAATVLAHGILLAVGRKR